MSRSTQRFGGRRALLATAVLAAAAVTLGPRPSSADEGGVSFWVPGFFGSLAATPQTPGFSVANIYYHASVKAGADVAFARQVSAGRLTANFSGNLNLNIKGQADLFMLAPSYAFAQPIWGAEAVVALLVPYGRARSTVDGTLNGALGPFGFTLAGQRTDSVTGFGDLAPMFSLRWNAGVHNVMTYVTGNLTVGEYDASSLANLGLGHNAIDGGAGYTYFNPATGLEFSSVVGFTYNFENQHTQYQNGVDMHWDWGASRFVTKQLQVGLVGYVYNQLTCDSGTGDRLGCNKSQVAGIGPQIGYVIPMGTMQGYVNLKGYREFDAEHRADGWNVWLTFAISPAPPEPSAPPPAARIARK